jgi:hypothetical protein
MVPGTLHPFFRFSLLYELCWCTFHKYESDILHCQPIEGFCPVLVLMCPFRSHDCKNDYFTVCTKKVSLQCELIYAPSDYCEHKKASIVNYHVHLQLTWLIKKIIILCVYIDFFLSSVRHHHVHLQFVWERNWIIILFAHRDFFSNVRPHVHLQFVWARERLITFCVSSLVNIQFIWLRINNSLHCVQTKGFSPVWVLMCTFSLPESDNNLLHLVHIKVFFPVWVLASMRSHE